MMDRRGFLRLLGGAVVAAAAPTKAYSFLGGILRPRKADWYINPPIVTNYRDTFEWKFVLGRPIFRITDLKVETNEKGEVISWAPTKNTKYFF